jgi:hypothetical protein
MRAIRRIIVEDFLFPPNGESDIPERYRAKPQGVHAVEWLVEFFRELALTKPRLQYPLGGASESTIRRDITAILKERKKRV